MLTTVAGAVAGGISALAGTVIGLSVHARCFPHRVPPDSRALSPLSPEMSPEVSPEVSADDDPTLVFGSPLEYGPLGLGLVAERVPEPIYLARHRNRPQPKHRRRQAAACACPPTPEAV